MATSEDKQVGGRVEAVSKNKYGYPLTIDGETYYFNCPKEGLPVDALIGDAVAGIYFETDKGNKIIKHLNVVKDDNNIIEVIKGNTFDYPGATPKAITPTASNSNTNELLEQILDILIDIKSLLKEESK